MDNFKLNHWIIDVKARLISIQNNQNNCTQILSEHQMAVLVVLAMNSEQILSVSQILQKIEENGQFSIPSDASDLHRQQLIDTIHRLKQLLESKSKAIEFIIGNPDIGYRLTSTAEPINPPQNKENSFNAFAFHHHSPQIKQSVFSSAGLIALFVFIVIIITLAIIGLSYNDPTTTVSNYTNSNSINEQSVSRVAVIPFTNNSEDGDDEYLGDGIAQELINSLAGLTTIDVLAHASSFAYKGQRMNPYQIGSRLNAKYVLKGSVKKNKQQVSVTMQLLWVKNNIEVWSKTYNQPYSELLNLQHKMFIDISKQLKLPLPVKMLVSSPSQNDDNRYGQRRIEAYHHFLVAQSHSQKDQAIQLTKAVNRYGQAIAEDATFALAYAQLAKVHIKQWQLGYIGRSNAERKAQVSLDKAFLLSPNLPEAYLTKGILEAELQQPITHGQTRAGDNRLRLKQK